MIERKIFNIEEDRIALIKNKAIELTNPTDLENPSKGISQIASKIINDKETILIDKSDSVDLPIFVDKCLDDNEGILFKTSTYSMIIANDKKDSEVLIHEASHLVLHEENGLYTSDAVVGKINAHIDANRDNRDDYQQIIEFLIYNTITHLLKQKQKKVDIFEKLKTMQKDIINTALYEYSQIGDTPIQQEEVEYLISLLHIPQDTFEHIYHTTKGSLKAIKYFFKAHENFIDGKQDEIIEMRYWNYHDYLNK